MVITVLKQSSSVSFDREDVCWHAKAKVSLQLHNMDSKTIRLEDDVTKSLRAIDMNFFCDNHAS